MDLYMWRLQRIGFSWYRAYVVCRSFENDLEALDNYITELEEL